MKPSERNVRRQVEGTVVSDKMDKTAVVRVVRRFRHPKYEKTIERWKKYYAHDEANEAKVGQKVRLEATRPYSKMKRWRIVTEER